MFNWESEEVGCSSALPRINVAAMGKSPHGPVSSYFK
jgi:hypothetical protein